MNDIAVDETIFEDYQRITGKRFRLSRDQAARVEAGTLTREQALRERFQEGLDSFKKREVRGSAWLDPNLTLENFNEKTGCRFRITPDQQARSLNREQAFQETLTTKRTEPC